MNLDDPFRRRAIIANLIDYSDEVMNNLRGKSYFPIDAYLSDYNPLFIVRRVLQVIDGLMVTELDFNAHLARIDDLKNSKEDDMLKWTFNFKVAMRGFIERNILGAINSIINGSKFSETEVRDYRVREFHVKLCQDMEMLRDWYKERYDL